MAKESGILVLLYRSLLKAAKEMEVELQRGQYLLLRSELSNLQLASGLSKSLFPVGRNGKFLVGKEGKSLRGIVRRVFREKDKAKGSEDIDVGFRTLRYMNARLPVFRKLVYKSVSDTVTDGVRVRAFAFFLGRDHFGYKFAYNVRIANEGTEPVTLVNREWIILDEIGKEEVVRGPGVVGQQPVILPGTTYEYDSGTPLRTRIGSMWGKFEMVKQNKKEVFEVAIAPFALLAPRDSDKNSLTDEEQDTPMAVSEDQ